MSKKKRENMEFKFPTRPQYAELGISRERIRELQSGCMIGKYTPEMLSKTRGYRKCQNLTFSLYQTYENLRYRKHRICQNLTFSVYRT